MATNITQTSVFQNSDTFFLETFRSALTAPCILLLFIFSGFPEILFQVFRSYFV